MTPAGLSREAIYIALGSNQDEPVVQIDRALATLDAHPDVQVVAVSRLYRTPPWGVVDQPPFVNAAARLASELPPEALLDVLVGIEQAAGRQREQRWGPRSLDLDLLLYGDRQLDTPRLQLPHPRMHERAFVLVPLLDIAPEVAIPPHGLAADLLNEVDRSGVEAIR
ncbi:MAG: 2-amino-4-hydroxy-6-hydroxymethyldihydropteridine diphosphokinase [Gammaproteobacteria bacterium]|nr:2-amino-4-hydroxy-6-hydroxymethyldihydropteridine diphosphokinase [Gammaproteobacteria bacterium]